MYGGNDLAPVDLTNPEQKTLNWPQNHTQKIEFLVVIGIKNHFGGPYRTLRPCLASDPSEELSDSESFKEFQDTLNLALGHELTALGARP